jgi:hypothetical protein
MVAKYPVEIGDQEGIVDAVNYLLSGPAGLGQNFDGYSTYEPAYLRPSTRRPWSLPVEVGDPPTPQPLNPSVYLNIPISDAAPVGGNPSQYVAFTFATPQATAPFEYGDGLEVYDIVDDGSGEAYNYSGYTVYSCTTTEVIAFVDSPNNIYTWSVYISGGWVGRDYLGYDIATDCYGTVTVSGGTDQVFVSAQLNIDYEYVTDGTPYEIEANIIRQRGFQSETPGSDEYLFADTVLISKKTFIKTTGAGSGTDNLEAIFTTVLDGPNLNFAYYRYYLQVRFDVEGGPVYNTTIGKVTMGLRSLVAQVVKE